MDCTKKQLINTCLYMVIGFLAIVTGIFTSPVNHYVTGLIMIVCAVVLYFFVVLAVADGNWLDLRAIFTGVWLATIGLAALRLTDYQEPWLNKTWILFAVAYLMFQIGANLGIKTGPKVCNTFCSVAPKLRVGRLHFDFREDRLFAICVVTSLIGLACFIATVAICGFIPAFTDSDTAYKEFYSKFHVFAVAATAVSGLCYYCIKTQKLSLIKKLILWLCILYLVFVFPILVVSRGVFVVAAVSLTVSVFYMNRKKLIVLIVCIAMILGVYLFVSNLRNYTDEYLDKYFEPAQIQISADSEETKPTEVPEESTLSEATDVPEESTLSDATDVPEESTLSDATDVPEESTLSEATDVPEETKNLDTENQNAETASPAVFSLSPKMVFLYSYLTVGYDNFNEAVENTVGYTYGTRQLAPFNVILRWDWINESNENGEFYQIRHHLTTVNLIGEFYYDFHEWGVIFLTLFWAFIFGIMQSYFETSKGPISLIVLGNGMVPVIMCFFSAWLSNFTQWMLWGVALLVWIAASARLTPKEKQ